MLTREVYARPLPLTAYAEGFTAASLPRRWSNARTPHRTPNRFATIGAAAAITRERGVFEQRYTLFDLGSPDVPSGHGGVKLRKSRSRFPETRFTDLTRRGQSRTCPPPVGGPDPRLGIATSNAGMST